MIAKKALIIALTIALLPQTVNALALTTQNQQLAQYINFNQPGVYNYRWAIQPYSATRDNTNDRLGGGQMPNINDSLANRITLTDLNNTNDRLGGGQMPDNTNDRLANKIIISPNNTNDRLGGGQMPDNTNDRLANKIIISPNNTNDRIGGGRMPEGSGITISYLDGNPSSDYPDNTNERIGSSTRPDKTWPSLISKLKDNRYPGARPDKDNETNLCDGRPYPSDIDAHWSEIYVRRLYDLCVVEGYKDGYFHPNAYVTRAELVKMGLFANGIEANHKCYDNDCGSPFYDLDEWQGKWVRPAYDRKIIQGYNLNEFRPNQAITREEAVKVVLATYGYAPINTSESFFKDVHGWSTGWIEGARIIGLVQGIGNGNFDPQRPITRAEAAKIIAKMIEHWDTNVSYDNQYRG